MFEELENHGWSLSSINHGELIAKMEFEDECKYLVEVLTGWSLEIENHIIKRGGGQADQTKDLTHKFVHRGWEKNRITVQNTITFENKYDEKQSDSTSHEIDHILENADGKLAALEIEWNNKDEFFDRDFQAMRRLYELDIIDLGIILTRGPKLELQFKGVVSEFFEREGILEFNDFSRLTAKFTDELGRERFSFPTNPQKKEIERKLRGAGVSFQDACADVFVTNKFGGTTTNWRQLLQRVERRDAGRTPMLFLGMPKIVI
jgi:hypothetical protein